MKILFFSALVSAATIDLNSAGNSTVACAPIPKDCSYYSRCVESVLPCGETGYSLGFGGKYCQAFKDNAPSFSPAGQEWLWDVMTCLQNQLIPIASNPGTTTCPELKKFAISSHFPCYTAKESSICDIPPSDWARLLVIIKKELSDIETWKLAALVGDKCAKGYVARIFDFLF
jgi:hypothetical protein